MQMFKNVMEELRDTAGAFCTRRDYESIQHDIMNAMQRCVLTLYSYDARPDDVSADKRAQTGIGTDSEITVDRGILVSFLPSLPSG